MYNDKGRSLIEIIFTILVILIISAVFARYWIVHLKEAREAALENQLTNIKLSLELYTIAEGRYPEDLRELDKRCEVGRGDSIYTRKYLEHQFVDKDGYPVDPHGQRFIYDEKTGTIKRGVQ
ncbi:MAG: type II secretion system protein GspG [Candidatus Omnitrophica bacterium]|nr:type II secretion system protein GspG [Candidatus Omnitrophota bacterium]